MNRVHRDESGTKRSLFISEKTKKNDRGGEELNNSPLVKKGHRDNSIDNSKEELHSSINTNVFITEGNIAVSGETSDPIHPENKFLTERNFPEKK